MDKYEGLTETLSGSPMDTFPKYLTAQILFIEIDRSKDPI